MQTLLLLLIKLSVIELMLKRLEISIVFILECYLIHRIIEIFFFN